jgi:hypothetical protein
METGDGRFQLRAVWMDLRYLRYLILTLQNRTVRTS